MPKKIGWEDLLREVATLPGFGRPEEIDAGRNQISFSTRDGGDVGEEMPGTADIAAANRAARDIHSRFSNVRASIETVDEWTHIDLLWSPKRLPPPFPGPAEIDRRASYVEGLVGPRIEAHGYRRSEASRQGERRWVVYGKNPFYSHLSWKSAIEMRLAPVPARMRGVRPEFDDWSYRLEIGRHRADMGHGELEKALSAVESISSASENFRDMEPVCHVVGWTAEQAIGNPFGREGGGVASRAFWEDSRYGRYVPVQAPGRGVERRREWIGGGLAAAQILAAENLALGVKVWRVRHGYEPEMVWDPRARPEADLPAARGANQEGAGRGEAQAQGPQR